MQHALLRWILAVVAVGTSACGVSANPDCGMSSFERLTPFSQCNHSIEKALEEFAFSERARLEPDVSSVNGTYLGIVTGVGERHIEMVLRDEERTLHWPEPLPFSVSPGEELAAQVDESSATFYFLEGSLALFWDERADPRQEGLRIGPIEAKWKTGCTSSRGKTLKLVVGDTSIAAGRSAEVQSWHIHHFGAVVDPASIEDCPGASAGSQLGAWIAHSTQERIVCAPVLDSDWRRCSPQEEAAVAEGAERKAILFGSDGVYRVAQVRPDTLLLRAAAGKATAELWWPGELPFGVYEGERVEISTAYQWRILTFEEGELAIALNSDPRSFTPPVRGPDGTSQLEALPQCGTGDSRAIRAASSGPGKQYRWASGPTSWSTPGARSPSSVRQAARRSGSACWGRGLWSPTVLSRSSRSHP